MIYSQKHLQKHDYHDEEFETLVSSCFKRIWGEFGSEGKVVVDLGCGKGAYLAFFGDNAVGVDISKPNLEACRAKGLSVVEGDLNGTLPFKNESVDIVLASHVIEHLRSPLLFLEETNRVLKPHGFLILAVPNEQGLVCWKYPYFFSDDKHLYGLTVANTKALLGAVGFTVQKILPDFHTALTIKLRLTKPLSLLEKLPCWLTRGLFYAYWVVAYKKERGGGC